jgi:hypothetical protein
MQAILLINCNIGKENQVSILQSLEDVKEIQATSGVYDVVVKLESNTIRELNVVRLKILKIKSIHSVLLLQATS